MTTSRRPLVLLLVGALLCVALVGAQRYVEDDYSEEDPEQSSPGDFCEPERRPSRADRHVRDFLEVEGCGKTDALSRPGRKFASRVRGGTEANWDDYPSFVRINGKHTTRDGMITCAGVLVGNRYVLTAKGCVDFYKAEELTATLKFNSGEFSMGISRICRSKWGSMGGRYFPDPVILRLEKPDDELQIRLKPACLSDRRCCAYEKIMAVGFGGSTPYEKLQQAPMRMTACDSGGIFRIKPGHFCVNGTRATFFKPAGPCEGDGGGPLYTIQNGRQTVVGIISSMSSYCRELTKIHKVDVASVYYDRPSINAAMAECAA